MIRGVLNSNARLGTPATPGDTVNAMNRRVSVMLTPNTLVETIGSGGLGP